MDKCQDYKKQIQNRLSRVEGQVKGIKRMIDQDKNCFDVLTQLTAIRGALDKVGAMVIENYSHGCVQRALTDEDKEKEIENLTKIILKFIK